ncbi:GH36-type glycosyl hydrolase domain-containing protein [Bacteroidota bacterium]
MQYGYFDDKNKEYVITSPDTPKSWSNYLGSTEYGAIITNNAGGYSFYKSGGMGRFTRLRFNSIPLDQPGRYIYVRDKESADYWSTSWQPVGKPLDKYKSECRHGSAYTIISSEYSNIKTETTYFVPLGQIFEVWKIKVTNNDSNKRQLSFFSFMEYANGWNAMQDLLNLQYTQYTTNMTVVDGIIDHASNINVPPMPDNFAENDQGRHTFMVFLGGEIQGYETDLLSFLGNYRTYANPVAVENGKCSNYLAAGDNVCGSIQTDIELNPGESKDLIVLVGIGEASKEGKQVIKEFGDINRLESELEKLKKYWHARINAMSVETPDAEFNSMLNMWSPYNCQMTFNWSRAASLVYTASERDGLGYRDSVQDLLGVMSNISEEAGKRLELMITGQVSSGGAMPVVNKINHKPGQESLPKNEEYRSDDCLWLFNVIPEYVKETGDISFYEKVLPYADKGEDTVLGHMKRAIQFNLDNSGKHGLPNGLSADWNDCLRFGNDGETVFVAMQLRYAFKVYIEVCEMLQNDAEINWAKPLLKKLDDNLQKYAWDGEWFIRGYGSEGEKYGSNENKEGKIYMNSQAWAIISGAATEDQAELAMKNVNEHLATEYGVALCNPPYTLGTNYKIVRAAYFNRSMKENGAIFTHTQGWAVIAEAILGHGNQAFKYFRSYMPSAYNTKAEVRQIEPYVYNQSTHGKYSPRFGNSRLPWLSGSATWSFYAATQYILGIQPEYDGITIDPCIPNDWDGFKVIRNFRGKRLSIIVKNTNTVEKGVKKMIVNGTEISGNFIDIENLKDNNTIEVIMG